jgi:ParB/RepB/Spo0J family partition protein
MPEIELKKIRPNRLNPRLEFTKVGLDELSDSIRQVGLIEPIIVRPKDEVYEVVVGERRYRAAQQAGLEKVPVIIKDYTDDEVIELNLIENVHREDLSAVEKGLVCKELLEQFPDKYLSQRALARRLGVDEDTVGLWLEAGSMPPKIQSLIAPADAVSRRVPKGKIDYLTATTITRRVKQPDRAAELVEQVAQRRVPRRVAVQIAKQVDREPQKSVAKIFEQVVQETTAVLPFSRTHADAILNGKKTQTSRKSRDPHIQPAAIVRAAITHFADLRVTDVRRKRLGDFDESDAQREGGYTLEEFKNVWKELHGEWNPQEFVYIIEFELVKAV